MIELISYEIKKIFKFQNMFLAIVVFLLLNITFLHYQEVNRYSDPLYYRALYKEKMELYCGLTEEEYQLISQKDRLEANIVHTFALSDPDTDFYKEMLKEYDERDPELLKQYLDGKIELDVNEAAYLVGVINDIDEEKTKVNNFRSDIETIIAQSQAMSSVSIFQNSKESISNIKKTAADYANIADVDPIFGDHLAIRSFLSEQYTFIFITVLMFMAVFALSISEANLAMSELTYAAKRGRYMSVWAKIAALILFLFGLCILFYAIDILYFNIIYGFSNLFDPVQSISGFENFTWRLNGAEAMIVLVFYRFLTIGALALSGFALLVLVPRPILAGALFLIFIVIEALFYYLIPLTSTFGVLRYLNIFSLFDLRFTVFQYHNIVLFDQAFNLKGTVIVMLVLLIMISIVISLVFYRPRSFGHGKRVGKGMALNSHTSILLHELHKSLFYNKGLVVLLLLGLYLFSSLDSYKGITKNVGYENLIREYGGKIDEEKIARIAAYRQELDQYEIEATRLEEQFKNGEITTDEYYKSSFDLNAMIMKGESLNYLEEAIDNAKGDNQGLVFEDGFKLLFDYGLNNTRLNGAMVNYLMIVIAVILCVAPLAVGDKIKGSDTLYAYTIYDHKRLEAKELITVMYCLVIAIIFAIWKYLVISRYFDLSYGEYGFGSIFILSNLFSVDLPLNTGYIAVSVIRFIVLLAIGEITLFLSHKSSSLLSSVLFAAMILLAPVLLMFFNIGIISRILPIDYFINSNAFVLDSFFFVKLGIIVLLIMSIGFMNIKIIRPRKYKYNFIKRSF